MAYVIARCCPAVTFVFPGGRLGGLRPLSGLARGALAFVCCPVVVSLLGVSEDIPPSHAMAAPRASVG